MKIKLLLLSGILASQFTWATPPVEEGKAIFTSRCASCHNVNKKLTGPALAGVHERRSVDWIIEFVRSSQSMVKKGDEAALAVYQEYNRIPMPDHTDLTEENIRSVIEYIKSESKTETTVAPFAIPAPPKTTFHRPLSLKSDAWLFVAFLAAVALLVAMFVFVVRLNELKKIKSANTNS